MVSGGLPTMMGTNDDATTDETPAEVITLTMDEVSSSGPNDVSGESAGVVCVVIGGDIVVVAMAGEDTENFGLETSDVVDVIINWRELDSVNSVESCSGVEEGGPAEISDGMALLLELVCVVDVTAKLEKGGSVATLNDVEECIGVISVVNAITEIVGEEVDCDSELPDSAELCRTVADKAKKGDDKTLVEKIKNTDPKEELLNSAELCWTVVDEDADNPRDRIVVDGSRGSDITVGVVLIDNRVVDVAIGKTAELDEEIANISIIEEATEGPVDIAETLVEESGPEVAIESRSEVGDGVTVTEEMASTVDSATAEMVAMIEGDVGTVLVETATPEDVARIVDRTVPIEDGEGIAREEKSSALTISAACARLLDPWSYQLETSLHTFSATPYTTACKCAAGINGNIPASTILKFCVPITLRSQHGFFEARM